MNRILLVEDDVDLAEITSLHILNAGYLVERASSISQALAFLEENTFSLILLDILLPDGDGYQLGMQIRERCHCPIIFMSCLDDSDSIISAFRCGGVDYMVKPARYDELLVRISDSIENAKKYSDRETPSWRENHIKLKKFTVDQDRRRVVLNDNIDVELSSIEFSLLQYMVNNRDKLLLYEDLYSHVWGSDCMGDVRTVLVHISNLRKKIDPNHLGIIETVRGAGYILCDI